MDPALEAAAGRAADAIRQADALVVGAGAGMGVDSGLPDFRGDRGFWKAYPPYERLGNGFVEAANPAHFEADPAFGWGFYGHRLALYRATLPHRGFEILRRWIGERALASFVFTSNVDGQFQKAGFDPERIAEVHGSIHHLQCTTRARRRRRPARSPSRPGRSRRSTGRSRGNGAAQSLPNCATAIASAATAESATTASSSGTGTVQPNQVTPRAVAARGPPACASTARRRGSTA